MRKMHTSWLALSALLTWNLAQAQAQTPVTLRFDWPEGLQASVAHTKKKYREEAGTQAPPGVTTRYELKTRRTGQELLIAPGPAQMDAAALASLPAAQRAQLQLLLQAALPSYLVSASGEFVRIEDAAGLKARLLAFMKTTAPTLATSQPLAQIMDQITSEPVLTALASAEWNQTVGTWLDATLDLGDWYTLESQGDFPLVPNTTIKMVSRFRIAGTLKCSRGGQEKTCVEIEMETRPDPADMSAAIQGMLQRFSDKALPGAALPRALDLLTTLHLVTEPDGLIPHRQTVTKRITVTTGRDDAPKTVTQVEDALSVYTYPAAQ